MTARVPLLGALAVVLRDNHVLLAQRGKDPGRGMWGFPGGHVEWGETVAETAMRELHEETSIHARAGEILTHFDLILREGDEVKTHYLLVGVACRYERGEPQAGDDAMDAAWIPIGDVREGRLPLISGVADLMRLAIRRGA
ncbi:NUDIX hydrolase [Lutimaribacter marinistellae]|uniref:NUDIX hydrolase n=1 Tax=Lutimaribacter marinistellae TaxID=1820329 RepID=A0ABV7TI03_9RHOB